MQPEIEVAAVVGDRDLELKGLSGGAIWCKLANDQLKFVAIAKEFDREEKLLVGSRLWPLLEEMRRKLESER